MESSEHFFPKAVRSVEEEVSRSIGAVGTQQNECPAMDEISVDSSDDDKELLLNVGTLLQRLIASVRVITVSQVGVEQPDLPQTKKLPVKRAPFDDVTIRSQ